MKEAGRLESLTMCHNEQTLSVQFRVIKRKVVLCHLP